MCFFTGLTMADDMTTLTKKLLVCSDPINFTFIQDGWMDVWI